MRLDAHRDDAVRYARAEPEDCDRSRHQEGNCDVDLAITLMPPVGNHNWALGAYVDLKENWRRQLAVIVRHPVSLVAIEPGTPLDIEVRRTGKLLWARDQQ
jgi:hypothetical protein